ncbi:twitching motility protein PilT [Opitutaceae bacterium TAV5]|nr:twitching motility protein PilT [Opitutaceae bacterium TAV5]
MRLVIDTNILVSALRSSQGASRAVLNLLYENPQGFTPVLSVPLYHEYQDVLCRPGMVPIPRKDIMAFCRAFAAMSVHQPIYFLWRPQLPDPKDEMALELAVAAGADYIITHNISDFPITSHFGVTALTPGKFLSQIHIKTP